MIGYSHCKINLGLSVIARRGDGFSDIETILYPVSGISDILEIVPSKEFSFSHSGIAVDCAAQHNLCIKALQLIEQQYGLDGNVELHLHKNIPFGAGLGGGSANAVAVFKILNALYNIGISGSEMERLASQIGSDTPFFVDYKPAVATGRGEILSRCDLNLTGKYLLIVKPHIAVSTAMAYKMVTPRNPEISPSDAIKEPIAEWKNILVNDFEKPIFNEFPILNEIKQKMYDCGALYSSMSGSGSAIFGIFERKPSAEFEYFSHIELI